MMTRSQSGRIHLMMSVCMSVACLMIRPQAPLKLGRRLADRTDAPTVHRLPATLRPGPMRALLAVEAKSRESALGDGP
jgi:hypothetical protein